MIKLHFNDAKSHQKVKPLNFKTMVIDFQSTNFKADIKLREFIGSKLQKMEKLYNRVLNATVYLKVNKASNKQNKIIEIKLNLPETQIFVSESDQTFETATDKAISSLSNQLAKVKARITGSL
jgi:putative sigma-54 modulation protein